MSAVRQAKYSKYAYKFFKYYVVELYFCFYFRLRQSKLKLQTFSVAKKSIGYYSDVFCGF